MQVDPDNQGAEDVSVVMQQSGYATDIVAIRDVVGNVHCTNFNIHFTGAPAKAAAGGHKVKAFLNGATEPVSALTMSLPASKPLGRCNFSFGRLKPDASTLRNLELRSGCNQLRFVYMAPPPQEKSSQSKKKSGDGNKAIKATGAMTSGGNSGSVSAGSDGIASKAKASISKNSSSSICSSSIAYYVDTKIYLWDATDKVVVTDIDGTLTTTDLMGHIKTVRLANYQYAHAGACGFFSSLAEYGFKVYYLTARPITWMNETRAFLDNVRQDGMALPEGPICCSTHHTAEKLVRAMFGFEYADRIKTRYLDGLHDVFARAGRDYTRFGRPLMAGFGNSRTDTKAYQNAQIPFRFNINKKSIITMEVESARSRSSDAKGVSQRGGLMRGPKRGTPGSRKKAGRRGAKDRQNDRRSAQRLKLGVWNVLQDTDAFLGQNAYETVIASIEECRAICDRKGFGGFAVWNNRAFFRRQSPARCFEARRRLVKCQFHLAPLYASEIEDINAKYDGEALVMTEESQSDAQEQGSEVDDTMSESDAESNSTKTDAHLDPPLTAAGQSHGTRESSISVIQSRDLVASATKALASFHLEQGQSYGADDENSEQGSAQNRQRGSDAKGKTGLAAAMTNSSDPSKMPTPGIDSAAHNNSDSTFLAADASSCDELDDPLSKIIVDPGGEHDRLVNTTSASAAAAKAAAEAVAEAAATAATQHSTSVQKYANDGHKPDATDDSDSDSDEDGFEDADESGFVRHKTNRPTSLSLTTRVFNSIKSLIPQFFTLLASPEMDDVDAALAGLEQLKANEEEGIAKLQRLEQQEEALRLNRNKLRAAVHGEQGASPATDDGQSGTEDGTTITIKYTESTDDDRDDKPKPKTKNSTSSAGISVADFFSIFTRASSGTSKAHEHTCFDSFADPKLHLILDIMSVQRAR